MEKISTLVELFREFINTDPDFQFVQTGANSIGSFVTFEMTNTVPANHFAPFYQISSIDQGREVMKELYPNKEDAQFDEKFDNILNTQQFDDSKPLFMAIYNSPRLKT